MKQFNDGDISNKQGIILEILAFQFKMSGLSSGKLRERIAGMDITKSLSIEIQADNILVGLCCLAPALYQESFDLDDYSYLMTLKVFLDGLLNARSLIEWTHFYDLLYENFANLGIDIHELPDQIKITEKMLEIRKSIEELLIVLEERNDPKFTEYLETLMGLKPLLLNIIRFEDPLRILNDMSESLRRIRKSLGLEG